ncbi:MAG TPA: tetratricopeptide repeat protein [Acidimicrobiia bacterium]
MAEDDRKPRRPPRPSRRGEEDRPTRLRVVRGGKAATKKGRGAVPPPKASKRARTGTSKGRDRGPDPRRRRRRPASGDVRDEILRLGGSRGPRYYEQLAKAADAFGRDHERDAIRILRPLRDALPESPSVRELLGLSLYRDGKFTAAARELEEYVRITDRVDQHPVLMDCYRAQRRWKRVDDLWRELAATSPPPELATEGRIVAAGALADRGRVGDALRLLGRRATKVGRPREYHLRLWYALADLEERAGNLPRARALFDRVRAHDAGFADVAERLAALA